MIEQCLPPSEDINDILPLALVAVKSEKIL